MNIFIFITIMVIIIITKGILFVSFRKFVIFSDRYFYQPKLNFKSYNKEPVLD